MSIASWLAGLRNRMRRLDDEDFADEIRAHLAIAAGERMADGADPQTAHRASLKDFGNVTLATEAARRVWTSRWIDALHDQIGDARYAMRTLAKQPAFALTVVGVLTLGIGLNAVVFTMLKGLALSPLAGVNDSAHLGVIYGETSRGRDVAMSYPDYQYLRDHDRAFTGLFGTAVGSVGLGRGRGARPVFVELVTGNYFQLLGVRAAKGRTLLPSDEIAPGQHPILVISDGLWRHDFGSDPDIVGKTIEINNNMLTVVGVADPSFHGTIVSYDVEAFVPVMTAPLLGFKFGSQQTTPSGILADRTADMLFVHGRLRPGVTLANAGAQADALWSAVARDRPLTDPVQRVRVVPFWQSPNGAQTYMLPLLIVLTAIGLLVLLIACANIAGLVLARGVSRRGEIAVRLALGTTRARVARLLILENFLLAAPGAVLGVLLAMRGIPVLVGYAEWLAAPERLYFNVSADRLVIAFAVFVGTGCALVFGFVPAMQSSRVDLVTVVNEDASPRGASRGRLRAGLVVAQVAISLLLLVCAGLATRSVDAAHRANPGFDADHVTAVALDVKQNAYDERRGRAFYRLLLDDARAEPGIESATLAAYVPLALLDTRALRVSIEGYEPKRGEDVAFMSNAIGPDYFHTLRIPLLSGRAFEDRDDETAAPVTIVNRALADRFWGGSANAVGKHVRVGDGDWKTVVGVVADVKYSRISDGPRPYFYLPFWQAYRSSMILHTRGSAPIDRLIEHARANVAAIDPELPIQSARSLSEQTRGAFIFYELAATMLLLFGAAGMALAAMGLYGLVSYVVKQSTHEIGIRMALGASTRSVVLAFLARGVRLGVVGSMIGIIGALGVGQLLRSVLFGVSMTDSASFARAIAVVFGVVIAATIVPAWRASRTNPLSALRHQ